LLLFFRDFLLFSGSTDLERLKCITQKRRFGEADIDVLVLGRELNGIALNENADERGSSCGFE
jgi:hypothetical protein